MIWQKKFPTAESIYCEWILTRDSTANSESVISRNGTSVTGDAMPDVKRTERVQRFRKSRRERGDREMNVWVPGLSELPSTKPSRAGASKSRQEAITHALEATFAQKERNVVT